MKSEHSFLHRIFQTIKQRLTPKPKQQCNSCGGWYRPSNLDDEGFCEECNMWGA